VPLNPPRRLLMGSGPSNPEPRVLQAMAAPPPLPGEPAFDRLLDDLQALGRRVFRTANPATLAVPGASRAGIEAVLASLVEPGDRVMVGVYGHFGELLCTLAARHGATVERVEAPTWGEPVDPAALVRAIAQRPPKVVAIVHADTSTGILQPLEAIGAACRAHDALFVVDAVLSLGGCGLSTDDWSIDAAIGGLQKCLGGPPGLAPLTFNGRVEQARAQRRQLPRSRVLDVAVHAAAWVERRDLADYATAGSLLLALREALRLIDSEGLAARWERHRRASQMLGAGLEAMGLRLFGDRAHGVPMITLVEVPAGVDDAAVRAQLLAEHGIEIMAAFGPLRGKVWRIGTMGTNAQLPSVLAVLAGLEAVLAARGLQVARGAAVDAALAEHHATVARRQQHVEAVADEADRDQRQQPGAERLIGEAGQGTTQATGLVGP
jgi:(S)-ureidoglycine-glyoxylate aminotransferase